MKKGHGPLWAITSFFNPLRYRRRLANYRRFRAALPLPLATIELGFDGRFELCDDDAELYLRVGGGDVMWQKERLLNLLLPQLPPTCEHLAWLDCDVLLPPQGWPEALLAALASAPVVQPYSSLHFLKRDGVSVELAVASVAARVAAGQPAVDVLGRVLKREGGAACPGMAWAARRELLQRHGLYDACVVGGGDTALACAAYGVPEVVMRLHHMNAHQRSRYLAWATPFHHEVRGRVGTLDAEIRHLWHGELVDRRNGPRHVGLAPHGFDPHTDIAPGADGAWRWASDKPALHAYVRDYFVQRQEDGSERG